MAAGPAVAPYPKKQVETLQGEQLSLRERPESKRESSHGTLVSPKQFALRSIPLVAMAGVLAAAINIPVNAALGAALIAVELTLGTIAVALWTRSIPK